MWTGVPLWCSELRTQSCHCSDLGHCCDTGLIPGLGTSTCQWGGPNKQTNKKIHKWTEERKAWSSGLAEWNPPQLLALSPTWGSAQNTSLASKIKEKGLTQLLFCSPLLYTLKGALTVFQLLSTKREKLPGALQSAPLSERTWGKVWVLGHMENSTAYNRLSLSAQENALVAGFLSDKLEQWVFRCYLPLERCYLSCLLPWLTDSVPLQFISLMVFGCFFFFFSPPSTVKLGF